MSRTQIIRTIKKSKSILISTHINPDPDALASELALALYLKSLKKTVYVVKQDPPPVRFKFFPAYKIFKSLSKVKRISYDVAVVVDCGDLDRIGKVKKILKEDKPTINIDHHITNDYFGKLNWVEPAASSTAEMLYD